jgi:transposase
MLYAGVDLHRRSLVVAVEDELGKEVAMRQFACEAAQAIQEFFSGLGEFRAVIEASSSYRWLYDLISNHGQVVLAHPYRLRAIVAGRAKTDKLDARALCLRLSRYLDGNRDELAPIRIPTEAEQRRRETTRRRQFLKREVRRLANRGHGQVAEYCHQSLPSRWWGPRLWKKVSPCKSPSVSGPPRSRCVSRGARGT